MFESAFVKEKLFPWIHSWINCALANSEQWSSYLGRGWQKRFDKSKQLSAFLSNERRKNHEFFCSMLLFDHYVIYIKNISKKPKLYQSKVTARRFFHPLRLMWSGLLKIELLHCYIVLCINNVDAICICKQSIYLEKQPTLTIGNKRNDKSRNKPFLFSNTP